MTRPRRFVMLDRDGTIIKECNYLSEPCRVELLPGAAKGLRRLSQMGLGLVVLTNQSGVGRGYFDEARLAAIHRRMNELLESEEIRLDGIYYCPHRPEENCLCRKPRTGMAERAAQELGFDLRQAFMVGDNSADIELGKNVGATTLLVRTGYGAQVSASGRVLPDFVVEDLEEAARVIERCLSGDFS